MDREHNYIDVKIYCQFCSIIFMKRGVRNIFLNNYLYTVCSLRVFRQKSLNKKHSIFYSLILNQLTFVNLVCCFFLHFDIYQERMSLNEVKVVNKDRSFLCALLKALPANSTCRTLLGSNKLLKASHPFGLIFCGVTYVRSLIKKLQFV